MKSDDDQLNRLYDAHASGLFRYLVTLVKNEPDARDLLQELFVKVAREYRPEVVREERAWLYRLAHNLALDALRRRQTRLAYELRSMEEVPRLFADEVNPDAKALATQLAEAMAALPVDQRTVTQMKLWEGLTFEEIAEAQSIPANTAASRYRYALDKLRSLLRPLYEELK